MKRLFYFVVILNIFQYHFVAAQNLVPNPSFEQHDTCISSSAVYYGYVTNWDTPSNGSADVFSTCNFSVPVNNIGYQYPHSGNAYAGAAFYAFSGPNYYIEYIQAELDNPLVAHEKYCVSFYVNHANRPYRAAVGNFGIYFSATHTYDSTTGNLNYIPQITEPNIISDDSAWILVYGQFTAVGGEKYIIIGNFNNESTSDTAHLVNGYPANGYEAYYYIDDVNVHCCTCDSTTSLHQGINELNKDESITISPNPFTSQTTISFSEEHTSTSSASCHTIIITDVMGKSFDRLRMTEVNGKSVTLDMSGYAKGIYFVQITYFDKFSRTENVVNKKIVLQ